MNSEPAKPDSAASSPGAEGGPGTAALFQTIVAEAEEGVVVLGPDGHVTYANPAAEFLLGHGRTELTGEMFGLPRADIGQTTIVNVISRDGQVRMAELRVEPLPSGPAGSLVLRLKDITAYYQDVSSAREQVRRRDEFLAMLSHEIRNPLSAIRSAALLLTRDGVPSDARHTAGEIFDRQFKHLERILADLLDVTRISRGKLDIQKGRVELGQVIRDALDEAAPLVARREHRLRVDVPQGKIWVEGDATRLEQVVVNLVNNAAKFTPPGGDIAVTVAAAGEKVEIRVRDNGPGIEQDLLPHVFEPFVQGKQSMARSEGGLGIGLSLVHTIVGLHGGSVSILPNRDSPGVSFLVRLPLSAPEPEQPAARPDAPARPLRILLVEDADDGRRMLRQILQLEGHEVFEAGDGPGGLDALLTHRPDVALVDIGLPGLDGYELARRARADERGWGVRLIAVTGYGMPRDVEEARKAGYDDHLIKPLRYPELCKLLREHRAAGPAPAEEEEHHCPGTQGA